MSHSNPPLNPFGSGPVSSRAEGLPDLQNPFQIAGGNGEGQPSSPSPFEAVGHQALEQIEPYCEQHPAPANPFEIVEGQILQQQKQAGGGFPMKGFPPGPAPVQQLEVAPIQANSQPESPEQQEAAPSPVADPFVGMDLPQVSANPGKADAGAASSAEDTLAGDFSAPAATESKSALVPEPDPNPEPSQQREKEESSIPEQPEAEESITGETKQLELRAIFGVDHELSYQEIMQRVRGLPGILNVAKVNSKEVEALGILQDCTSKLGLREGEPIVMSCSQGLVDFHEYEGTSLAILRKGKYFPGVRETLIICARELDKL
ncbi:MAG TPA: hypothetical protein DCS85_04215 [Verrucomicrobiales bacterium]|nr:hypothetical protein [Verrucomicrobiales bacterium]